MSLIQQWKRRILTPIGRISIVKTLILSKLNHLFISIPTPQHEKIKELCANIFEFIWKSKCDKVKRAVVTQEYLSGGLKMVNIDHFIKSLKCSWIKKLIVSNSPWVDIFVAINGHDVGRKILDFGDDYISNNLRPKNNNFWCDVFSSWLSVMKKYECEKQVKNFFCSIPVWYNSNIKVSEKSVFFKEWYQNGVKNIGDFMSNDCVFLSKEVFQQTFNIPYVCVMKYNSMICAISKYLKLMSVDKTNTIKECSPYLPFYYVNILLNEKCTKPIYNSLNSNDIIPNSLSKWRAELSPFGVTDICLQGVFKSLF